MENKIERYEMLKKAFNDMNIWFEQAERDKDILAMVVALNIFIDEIEKYVLPYTRLYIILVEHHMLYDSERIVKICKKFNEDITKEDQFRFPEQSSCENGILYNLRIIAGFYNYIVNYKDTTAKDYKNFYAELDNLMAINVYESFHDIILAAIP